MTQWNTNRGAFVWELGGHGWPRLELSSLADHPLLEGKAQSAQFLHICLDSGWSCNVVGTLFPQKYMTSEGEGEARRRQWRRTGNRGMEKEGEKGNTREIRTDPTLYGQDPVVLWVNVLSRSVGRGKGNAEQRALSKDKALCGDSFYCIVFPLNANFFSWRDQGDLQVSGS